MPSPFPGMNPYLEHQDVWHDFHESFFPIAKEFLIPQLRPHFILKIDQHVYIHELASEAAMPSPFPGMNPYLEHPDVWHDFHEKFIPAVSEVLVPQVVPNFIVKVDQHVYIHDLSEGERFFIGRTDAYVAQLPEREVPGQATATIAAPTWANLPVVVDREKVSFLEIRDREDRELVTVIELLSPANKKPGKDREEFLGKRSRYVASGVHYVEIDLLRAYPRMPLEDLVDCDYYAMVSRWETRPRAGVWPVRLRDPLPTIPIPLRRDHPEAKLDLKVVLDRVYDASGYAYYIYTHTPQTKVAS